MTARKTQVATVTMVHDKTTKNKERFNLSEGPIVGTIYVPKGEDAPTEILVKLSK